MIVEQINLVTLLVVLLIVAVALAFVGRGRYWG